jgi:hypothetical protein
MGLRHILRSLATLAVVALLTGTAAAQLQAPAGVVVDADGVLRTKLYEDPTGELSRERLAAAKSSLNPEVAAASKLRKVSLTRLEKAIEKAIAEGRQPTDEMKYLAGLTRVKYVFYYPETKDIVIAGPAEGWMIDLSGRPVGINSGRSITELQDLIVALRAYSPTAESSSEDGNSQTVIGCSIDPTAEGLQQMQAFLQQLGGHATPDDTQYIVDGLRTALGLQKVRVMGISPKTHFAQVLVEADYRMKLIGIGLEQPPIKMASYVDRAKPRDVSRNALQRWYFTPDYQCVKVSESGDAMELVGDGVKLIGADEMVTGDGQRVSAGRVDRASEAFVTGFTRSYPQLADRVPVYAQLRNLVDMTIAAAYLREHDLFGQAGWTMPIFGDESKLPVETCNAPVEVETAVASIWRGNKLMTPVGGGVVIEADQALDSTNVQADAKGEVSKARESQDLSKLTDGQWWWD